MTLCTRYIERKLRQESKEESSGTMKAYFEEIVTGRSPSLLKTDERNEVHTVTAGIKASWKVIF